VKSPCAGLSMRRTKTGIAVIRAHYEADPSLTPEMVAKMRSEYTSDAHWRKEMEIEYGALGGALIYPEFSDKFHIVPDAEVPSRGCRYMAIDPHPRTPHACLWALVDPWNDIYIYRELWPSVVYGETRRLSDNDEENFYSIKEYAETIAYLEGNSIDLRYPNKTNEHGVYSQNKGGEKIIVRFMDQAGKGFRATAEGQPEENYAARYARFGIRCSDPKKSHHAGEDAIRAALKMRMHDTKGEWPRLHIAASCIETQLEFKSHKYKVEKSRDEERDLNQERAKARCHMIDLIRYLLTSPALRYIPGSVS
jgi:hypothetical protein